MITLNCRASHSYPYLSLYLEALQKRLQTLKYKRSQMFNVV